MPTSKPPGEGGSFRSPHLQLVPVDLVVVIMPQNVQARRLSLGNRSLDRRGLVLKHGDDGVPSDPNHVAPVGHRHADELPEVPWGGRVAVRDSRVQRACVALTQGTGWVWLSRRIQSVWVTLPVPARSLPYFVKTVLNLSAPSLAASFCASLSFCACCITTL